WRLAAATTTVEASIDGVAIGRRSLRRIDPGSYFVELRGGMLSKLGREPGARVALRITPASTELPRELADLIAREPAAAERSSARTESQKRMLREDVLSARSSETRARRARSALLPAKKAPAPRVAGLAEAPRTLSVRIAARDLPGRSCGCYADVRVGLV